MYGQRITCALLFVFFVVVIDFSSHSRSRAGRWLCSQIVCTGTLHFRILAYAFWLEQDVPLLFGGLLDVCLVLMTYILVT